MPRIISDELNKKLRREYRLRFFTLLFFAIFFAIVINVLLASSSYLLLSLYERAYVSGNTLKQGEEDFTVINERLNTKVTQLHALAQKIPTDKQDVDFEVFKILVEYANQDINISAIEIVPEGPISKITLRGDSLTRESLLQFQNNIKRDTSFEGFSIPIESLAKQKDISFNVTFIHYEN